MSFTDAVKTCFQKYAVFDGRARRSEYWYFTLFTTIVSFLISRIFDDGSLLSLAVSLAVFIPGLSVGIRRMHDIGRSGWYVLLALIPLVGAIILIAWCCQDSVPGDNQYGPNPKNIEAGFTVVNEEPAAEPFVSEEPVQSPSDYSAAPYTDEICAVVEAEHAAAAGFCSYCGSALKPGQKFCENCGARVE